MACDVCMGINSRLCPACGKEAEHETCHECKGRGYSAYYALDIDTEEETEVIPLVWSMLPGTADEARSRRQHFIRGEREECMNCNGTGETGVEDGPYGAFDEDAAMEKYYERKYGNC